MWPIKPFIHAQESRRLRVSASGSACVAKPASAWQCAARAAQPLPASQASRNAVAVSVIDAMVGLPVRIRPEITFP
jgi:hypothetical protein